MASTSRPSRRGRDCATLDSHLAWHTQLRGSSLQTIAQVTCCTSSRRPLIVFCEMTPLADHTASGFTTLVEAGEGARLVWLQLPADTPGKCLYYCRRLENWQRVHDDIALFEYFWTTEANPGSSVKIWLTCSHALLSALRSWCWSHSVGRRLRTFCVADE